jgi:multisubunit Na+/H+ antiporter MnhB subunit
MAKWDRETWGGFFIVFGVAFILFAMWTRLEWENMMFVFWCFVKGQIIVFGGIAGLAFLGWLFLKVHPYFSGDKKEEGKISSTLEEESHKPMLSERDFIKINGKIATERFLYFGMLSFGATGLAFIIYFSTEPKGDFIRGLLYGLWIATEAVIIYFVFGSETMKNAESKRWEELRKMAEMEVKGNETEQNTKRKDSISHEDKERLKEYLTAKYNPRQPVTFFIDMNDIGNNCNTDQLQIEFETLDYYINHPNDWYITFKDPNGNVLCRKKDERSKVIERLLKAHFNSYMFDVEIILSANHMHQMYRNAVKIVAKPYKTNVGPNGTR